MACTLIGPIRWECQRDENSHRDYTVSYLVRCASKNDGPAQALQTPGLPVPGNFYQMGNDVDNWAWCRWTTQVTPLVTREPNKYFEVQMLFSSKPPGGDGGGGSGGGSGEGSTCRNFSFEDPLLEPQRISGTFSKFTEEATHDRFGRAIMTSSFEQIRGPQVEFDRNRPTIRIEQNVPSLNLPLLCQMVDTVNEAPMWGLGPRMIKLSNVSWERKFYGACYCYYTRIFDFDINYETFDRVLLDEGNKVLRGHWNPSRAANQGNEWVLENINGAVPNPRNPTHFIRYKDRHFENSRVILNGAGLPAGIAVEPTTDFVSVAACPNKRIPRDLVCIIQNVGQQGLFCDKLGAAGRPLFPTSTRLRSTSATSTVWRSSTFYTCGGIRLTIEFTIGGASVNGSLIQITQSNPPDGGLGLCLTTNTTVGECDPFRVNFGCDATVQTGIGPLGNTTTVTGKVQVSVVEARPITQAGLIVLQKYNESNFLLLGIPLDFACNGG